MTWLVIQASAVERACSFLADCRESAGCIARTLSFAAGSTSSPTPHFFRQVGAISKTFDHYVCKWGWGRPLFQAVQNFRRRRVSLNVSSESMSSCHSVVPPRPHPAAFRFSQGLADTMLANGKGASPPPKPSLFSNLAKQLATNWLQCVCVCIHSSKQHVI